MRLHTFATWLVALLAAALLVAGCGSDEDAKDDEPKRDAPAKSESKATLAQVREFTITVANGLVKGGPKSLRVEQGARVRITVTSDAEDEAHLHGIDIETEVGPGTDGLLEFTAKDQGSYELELHEAGTVLGAVVVS